MTCITSRSWVDCWRSRPACHEVKHIGGRRRMVEAITLSRISRQLMDRRLKTLMLTSGSVSPWGAERSHFAWELDISSLRQYECIFRPT